MVVRRALWVAIALAPACNALSGVGDVEFSASAASGAGAAGGGGTMSTSVSTGETSSVSNGSGHGAAGAGAAGPGSGGSVAAAGGSGGAGGAGGGTIGTIDCDGTTCPLGSQSACCWDNWMTSRPPQGECVTLPVDMATCNNSAFGQEAVIQCQFPSQCPGQICCGHRVVAPQFFYETVRCEDTCEWLDVQLCDPAGPAGACPIVMNEGKNVPTSCMQSDLLPPGYFVCGLP